MNKSNYNDVIEVLHPHIRGFVNQTEDWLAQKAAQGFRLESNKGWKFTFRKCQPYEGKYFMYSSFDASGGVYSDYHMAKKRYGKTKSTLNKCSNQIFEVDLQKIDKEFESYKQCRDKFYRRHYLLLWILSGIIVALPLCFIRNMYTWFIIFIPLIMFIYSSVSLIGLLKS